MRRQYPLRVERTRSPSRRSAERTHFAAAVRPMKGSRQPRRWHKCGSTMHREYKDLARRPGGKLCAWAMATPRTSLSPFVHGIQSVHCYPPRFLQDFHLLFSKTL